MNSKRSKTALSSLIKKCSELLPMFFWALLIFGVDDGNMAVMTILSAFIHEAGHIGYILIAKKVRPTIKGAMSGFRIGSVGGLSYDEEIKMYLAGPTANVISFLLSSLLSKPFGLDLGLFAAINLATAISNLIPIKGYDGYGIIRALITKNEYGDIAIKALSFVSTGLIFIFCILSLYFINRFGGGYWIFFVFFFSMLKHFKGDFG